MMTAHFFPNCKNLILKIYICKIANRQRRHSTIYIYIVCKTDMARNWRIYHQTQVKGNI